MTARIAVPVMSAVLALGLAAGPAAAQEPPGQGTETVIQAEIGLRGVVAAVDLEQRLLTLDTGTGTRVLPVDPRVEGLERIAVGDVLDIRYHRSILFDIQPAGSAEPGAYIAEDGRVVDGNGSPVRVGEQEVTVYASVIQVDAADGSFTVQGPLGDVRTLHAEEPAHREAVARIRVGDLLRVRFREGLAVALAPVEQH